MARNGLGGQRIALVCRKKDVMAATVVSHRMENLDSEWIERLRQF